MQLKFLNTVLSSCSKYFLCNRCNNLNVVVGHCNVNSSVYDAFFSRFEKIKSGATLIIIIIISGTSHLNTRNFAAV